MMHVFYILFIYICLGGIFGCTAGVCMGWGIFGGIILAYYGAYVGLFSSPLGLFCLWRKDLFRAALILFAITESIIIILTLLCRDLILATCVSIIIFLATTIALKYYMLDVVDSIGLCEKCGYNLTGNISGICPECGTKVQLSKPSPVHPKNSDCIEND